MSTALPTVTLKPGHVRPVWSGHPWVYAQAVARVEGGATAGDEVAVVDPRGNALGSGLFSPNSAIAVRMFTRGENAPRVDAALLRDRVAKALARRRDLGLPGDAEGGTTGYRLVHGEGDQLPGLIVDVFGDVLAVQIGTAGLKRREGAIFEALTSLLSPRAILDRTPAALAKREGFEPGSGVVRGDDKVTDLEFVERGVPFRVPLSLGQKTGFYLDQRPLRSRVEALASGKTVLDVYSYVGAFSLFAARGGATQITAVDSSALALEAGATIARGAGLEGRIDYVRDDATNALEMASRKGGRDLVIVDPPKLAPARGSRDSATSLYERLAAHACRATKPGGTLVFCSCSAAVGENELVRALALGARAANVAALVVERASQGPDHPVPAAFPEGRYLSSVIARIETL